MNSVLSSTVCLISATLAGFLGGRAAAPSDAIGIAPVLDEVRTRRLVIVDERGDERGIFEVGLASAASRVTLWMGGPEGNNPSATLWVDELEGVASASLLLSSEHGGTTRSAGRLYLHTISGQPPASLTYGEGEGRRSIPLGHEKPDSTAALTFDSGESTTTWPPH